MENRIRELRQQHGIRQIELCQQLGVSQATLSLWENGKFEPDHKHLLKLSEIFNVSIEYLLGIPDEFEYDNYGSDGSQIWVSADQFKDKKIQIIQEKYGPLGYVAIFDIFTKLVAFPEGAYFWNSENANSVLSRLNTGPDEDVVIEKLNDIVLLAVDIGLFDKAIFKKTNALVPTTNIFSRYRPSDFFK